MSSAQRRDALSNMSRFQVYCLARSSDVGRLEADLVRSPEIASGKVGLAILWNQASAAGAYARAMEGATAPVVVFAHCDVYFPDGWFDRLAWELDRLAGIDPNWAVAGIASMTADGEQVGRVYDSAFETLGRENPWGGGNPGVLGKALAMPVAIVSADELVLVVRREAGVSFDPLLPDFHLYGTDIILEAERQGKRSYGLDLPLIHNAKAQLRIGRDYRRAYKYMVRKWRRRLPVPTTCGSLTATPFAFSLRRLRIRYKAICRPSTYSTRRISDPHAKARELGFDKLLAAPMADVGLPGPG